MYGYSFQNNIFIIYSKWSTVLDCHLDAMLHVSLNWVSTLQSLWLSHVQP